MGYYGENETRDMMTDDILHELLVARHIVTEEGLPDYEEEKV